MPEFCVPDVLANYYAFLTISDELGIFSFYGPDWENQVTQLCERVGEASCAALQATVGAGFKEVAVQELDQMWQNSFSGAFN